MSRGGGGGGAAARRRNVMTSYYDNMRTVPWILANLVLK